MIFPTYQEFFQIDNFIALGIEIIIIFIHVGKFIFKLSNSFYRPFCFCHLLRSRIASDCTGPSELRFIRVIKAKPCLNPCEFVFDSGCFLIQI